MALQIAGSTSRVRASSKLSSVASESSSVTETVNGSHHLTINGYSLVKGMGVGKYIASETFTVAGFQWAIYFYPDGKNAEDNSLYVSVFIALASEGTDVRALFELTLLDQSGKGKHKVHSHFDRSLESGPYTLKYRGSMWGYKRFFRRTALETSDFLKDDSLAITCTVGVVVSSLHTPIKHHLSVPETDIGKHFGALLKGEGNDITSDISLEVKGEAFRAHKLVLATRSPVFKAQLFGPMRNKEDDVLHIQDIEPPVFKAMLHFIYHDELPDTKELTGSPSPSTSTMLAQHLLAAADQYGLERLRLLCEARLCEDITVDTVATTLALAEQHHTSQLKTVCLEFAAANLQAVMKSEGYNHLRESCPVLQTDLLHMLAGIADINKNRGNRLNVGDGADANGRRVRQKT